MMQEASNAVRTEWIELPVDSTSLQTLIVEPADGHAGTILMIHENRGLVPYMTAVAGELAVAGYRVVAPDLLSRIGGTRRFADDPTAVSTRDVDAASHISDLLATFDWIAREEVPAVIGFCFGAEMGWQVITQRRPRGVVLYYGIGPDPDRVGQIDAPVYAVYAEDDPRVNATLEALMPALAAADIRYLLESYPGTKHAFHDRTRPERFHPEAADAAWRRTLRFLAELFDRS